MPDSSRVVMLKLALYESGVTISADRAIVRGTTLVLLNIAAGPPD